MMTFSENHAVYSGVLSFSGKSFLPILLANTFGISAFDVGPYVGNPD
jgi:hypothetical protein